MIEINLLPGAARGKSKGRVVAFSPAQWAGRLRDRVKDRYLVTALAASVLAAVSVGTMHLGLARQEGALQVREEKALADSTRFAGVLRARLVAEAKRDSVRRQLDVIRAIDGGRFVWAHIMDEVSRALPPYTWLKSLAAHFRELTVSATRRDDVRLKDWLHLSLALLAFVWVGRNLGLRWAAAFTGAVVYVFSGYTAAHLVHYNFVTMVAHVPLLVAVLQTALRRNQWRWWGLLGLEIALAYLSGHPQIFLMGLTAGLLAW